MWWWRRRRAEPPVFTGPIPDGDTVCRPGQPRWADLVTREYPPANPPAATDMVGLVRPYIQRGYVDRGGNEFWWNGSAS
jgi:hypothetical protein